MVAMMVRPFWASRMIVAMMFCAVNESRPCRVKMVVLGGGMGNKLTTEMVKRLSKHTHTHTHKSHTNTYTITHTHTCSGLVQEEQRGVGDQLRCDVQTLLLAARNAAHHLAAHSACVRIGG